MTRGILAAVFLLGACYTSSPLHPGEPFEPRSEAVAFATVTVANHFKPDYRPNLLYAVVAREVGGDRDGRNTKLADPYRADDASADYLISFALEPGDWTLEVITGNAMNFPIAAQFIVPVVDTLPVKFTVPEGRRFVYFGHLDATVVERTSDDQPRAGAVIPLIDQRVAGASTGTFEIRLEDHFAADVKLAQERFGVPPGEDVLNATAPAPAAPAP